MACINPNDPEFLKILARVGNPILAEIEFDKQNISQPASPKLISLMKEFIKQIGVDYKLVSDVVVDGKKEDANGVALIMQKLIQVVEGKEDEALPEEAMHFAVEIIKQTNPKLYQKLLKEINGHPKLNEVVANYGNDPRYQKDGKRDFLKLKEEAIAKVLANRLEDVVARTWWDSIVDYLKGLFFARSGFDQASIDVLSFYSDVNLRESFLEQAAEQANIYDLSKNLGYRPKTATPAHVKLDVFQVIPASGSGANVAPDFNYALSIKSGMRVRSTNSNTSTRFRTLDVINFAYSSSYDATEVSVYEVDPATNTPTYFLLKKQVNAVSGEIK